MDIDPYEVLGVKQDATLPQIKRAYKNIAMKLHPDKIGNNPKALDQMKLVNEAYALLKNRSIRESFDETNNWDKEASIEDREKVWMEYSTQVENYYNQVQGYLTQKLAQMEKEKDRLSKIEIKFRDREKELKKREKAIGEQIEVINRYGGKEKGLVDRERSLSKKQKELDDLLLHISKAYSLIVEISKKK